MIATRYWMGIAVFLGAVLVSSTCLAQGAGPTGWGWCPVCGRDMPASHFPHVTGGGDTSSGTYYDPERNIFYRQRMAVERYNNGMDAFNRGDFVKAEQWFREALDWAMRFDSHPHRMIGQCLEKRGLENEALEAYQTALRRNPLDWITRGYYDALRKTIQAREENQAGETFANAGQWRDALRKFEHAVSLNSQNALALDNRDKARRHVRYEDGTAAVQRIVNGLVVEVQAPTPPASVQFQVPGERTYDRSDPVTTVPVGSRVEAVAIVAGAAPPAGTTAAAAAPEGGAPPVVVAPAAGGQGAGAGTTSGALATGGKPAASAPAAAPPADPPPSMSEHFESMVLMPNPLNAVQNARDRELLKPVDEQRLMALPPDCAVAYLSDRINAAERQIPLASAERFEEEVRKL